MKTRGNRRGGFIKKLTIIVVGVCLAFIVLMFVARYIGPMTLTDYTNSYTSTNYTTSHPNPLIDFGNSGTYGSLGGNDRGTPNTDGIRTSPYAGKVTLSSGNGGYSVQPYEEYVMLTNSSGSPVNITGWVLTNGKGSRPIQNSQNSYFYPSADTAIIGEGTEFLDPSNKFQVGPIYLAAGDQAYVITGGPFSQYPFSLYTSFRENICDGYLKNYPFDPPLYQQCPYPSDDPDIRSVTDECYDYMRSLSRCEDPYRDDKKRFDEQTSQCKNFMLLRLNYAACVTNHKNQPGFSSKTWRVFLGQKREMWASQRETITLYDKNGQIVDRVSY